MRTNQIINRLVQLVDNAKKLEKMKPLSDTFRPAFDRWMLDCKIILESTFGKTHTYYEEFERTFDISSRVRVSAPLIGPLDLPRPFRLTAYHKSIKKGRIILESAVENLKSGYIFDIKHLVSAEVFDSLIDEARDLLGKGYTLPAAVIGRIVVEDTLRNICSKEGVVCSPTEKISAMNDKLIKAGVYDKPKWREIQSWIDLGNMAAHGKISTPKDVSRMLDGITAFIGIGV